MSLWIPGGALTVPALFIAGVASGGHCLLMCGALSAVHGCAGRERISRTQTLALIYSGRVLGYAALGALAGLIGASLLRALPGAGNGRWIQGLAALALIVAGLNQWRNARRPRAGASCLHASSSAFALWPMRARLFLRGVLWALMPCPLLYSVALLAAFTGSALQGGLLLAAFGLGSSPLLAAAGWSGVLAPRQRPLAQFSAALLISLGALSLAATAGIPGLHDSLLWCQVG